MSASPYDQALGIYLALGGVPGTVRGMVIPGAPRAQKRHRDGKGFKYDPSLGDKIDLAHELRGFPDRPSEGNLALVAIFYRPDRRWMDGDNLQKLLLDAGTRANLWHDDCQVTAGAFVIELDKLRPRTVVLLGPHNSTLDRSNVEARKPPAPKP